MPIQTIPYLCQLFNLTYKLVYRTNNIITIYVWWISVFVMFLDYVRCKFSCKCTIPILKKKVFRLISDDFKFKLTRVGQLKFLDQVISSSNRFEFRLPLIQIDNFYYQSNWTDLDSN